MTTPLRPEPEHTTDPPPGPDTRVASEFFDDAYHRLISPFHPEEDTRGEVAAIREILGLAQDDLVLDLGCGWGRHLALLADAGHRVVGLDLSPALLRRVPDGRSATRARARELIAGDMRRLPVRDHAFDVVINLATSLGLFHDDRDVIDAFAEARRVLRPDGRLLVESMHHDDVVSRYAARDAWTMADGTQVRVRRHLDARRRVSHEVLRWDGPAGAGTKRHSLRLRTAIDMIRLLDAAALDLVAVYGAWHQEPFGRESERIILLATP